MLFYYSNMNIAISGFTQNPEIKNFFYNNFNVSEVIDNDVKFLITRENIDNIDYKSSKIKQAMEKNLPIVSFEDFKIKNSIIIK